MTYGKSRLTLPLRQACEPRAEQCAWDHGRAVLVSLVLLVARIAVATAIALLVALPISFAYEDRSFGRSFGVASLIVGCLALLMTFGGSSPGRRMGLQSPWFASFFPPLTRIIGEQYSRTTLSDSALFALTGIVLLAIGFALVA